MAKSQLQSNPNMMLFSGDNINIPNSFPNASLNLATNSFSAPLPNNLQLNVSIPNSEKLNLNSNLRGAYLNNINSDNLPVNNLNWNNSRASSLNAIQSNQLILNNNNNLNGISLVGINGSAYEQINLNNGINSIPQGLNASLLPQPIPIQMDKNANIALGAITAQAQIGNMFGQPGPDKNTHMFNLNVHYKNQITQQSSEVLDLVSLERKVENLTNMPDSELSAILSQLRVQEFSMKTENEKLYKTLKRYENQNNVIMDTLKEQINETHNQLNSMVVEVPLNERPFITKEIEDQFTKSLSGYTINKNKYAHLKEIDPTEIYNIANQIKRELDRNDKFYLHGDFNFYH